MADNFKDKIKDLEQVIVCNRKGVATPFTDNQTGNCIGCGCEIYARPYVDFEKMPPVCIECVLGVMDTIEDPADQIRCLPEAEREFDEHYGAGRSADMIEKAKAVCYMQKAVCYMQKAGIMPDTFTCAVCGKTYSKGRSDEEAMAEFHQNFPGNTDIDEDELSVVCSSCHKKWSARPATKSCKRGRGAVVSNDKALWVLQLCRRNGYKLPITIDDTRYAAIYPMAYGDTIIIGKFGDETGWEDQYWYERGQAQHAMLDWIDRRFKGEPEGWHRHIPSNRRRENGDPSKEEIRP